MTLLDDLERLHAEAPAFSGRGVEERIALNKLHIMLAKNAPRLLAMLRAAEGMREALAGARDGLREAPRPSAGLVAATMQEEYDRRLEAASEALSAYDAAKGE